MMNPEKIKKAARILQTVTNVGIAVAALLVLFFPPPSLNIVLACVMLWLLLVDITVTKCIDVLQRRQDLIVATLRAQMELYGTASSPCDSCDCSCKDSEK